MTEMLNNCSIIDQNNFNYSFPCIDRFLHLSPVIVLSHSLPCSGDPLNVGGIGKLYAKTVQGNRSANRIKGRHQKSLSTFA